MLIVEDFGMILLHGSTVSHEELNLSHESFMKTNSVVTDFGLPNVALYKISIKNYIN